MIERKLKELRTGNPDLVIKTESLSSDILELVEQSRKELIYIGLIHPGLLDTNSHVFIRSLEQGVQIRILLPNPQEKDILEQLTDSSHYTKDYLVAQLSLLYERAKSLAEYSNNQPGTIEIRTFSKVPALSGVKVDQSEMIVIIPVYGRLSRSV